MTQAAALAQYGSTGVSQGFKNRIINGAMVIDQRNAGASGTAGDYTLDRWQYQASQSSKVTWQQNAGSVTPPAGFKNYLGITSSSAYSVASGDYFFLCQTIEGYNIADLGWGTANAKTVTVSFWVRSSLTGTFGGAIRAGGFDQSYPFSYTISSANTWEYKTITIAGATSGTFGSTNGNGLQLDFSLGMGSTYSGTAGAWSGSNLVSATGATSVVGTNGATFYITGVQLEVGSTATSFDYRPYGTELQLCQRYYTKFGGNSLFEHLSPTTGIGTSSFQSTTSLPVQMRATPTVTSANLGISDDVNPSISIGTVSLSSSESGTLTVSLFRNSGLSGIVQYRPYSIRAENSLSAFIGFSAEL